MGSSEISVKERQRKKENTVIKTERKGSLA